MSADMSAELNQPLSASEPPSAPVSDESALTGTVLAVQANFYFVQLDQPQGDSDPPIEQLLCTRRTRLKKIGQQVMVGDQVRIEEPDWEGKRGAIAEVFSRQTELDRPPIANADQILLVFAIAEPTLDPVQLSRFLVKAESTGLGVCLCLNKKDLVSEAERAEWGDRLHDWGYDPVMISVWGNLGLLDLEARLIDRMSVVSGPSGVGKSSLINALIPAIDLRVGRVSGKLGRGRHTTRHVELFQIPGGGLLADTPGFNQPDLDCLPGELAQFFPECRQRLSEARCQFSNCLHRDEPNCAVRGDWERYDLYLMFLEEVIARQEAIDRTGDPESTTKVKIGGEGQIEVEPKLQTKKYRRPSRRTEKQLLRGIVQDVETLIDDGDAEV
ncbi:small ribosomal subunit biogenesis GTPase RsgA [Leptolyngbya sp. FACHB-711]|uniref:small ribosomal subunit biogenesis GTPase RsgA n=1 Tax=Leptolyngbya sp. FACHB-711 TaxID=2692813 RepID=UPI001F54EE45|nr:small ribosomal subunit biogenesis GTPase RsgA [Leptolyngbya sp. FACHB-711]